MKKYIIAHSTLRSAGDRKKTFTSKEKPLRPQRVKPV